MPKRVDLNLDFMKMVYADDNESALLKEYYFNSLLQAYSTEESYGEALSKVDGPPVIYGNSIYEEVLRYGAVGEKIGRTEDFDIIHAHDFRASIISALLPFNVPIISHIHQNPKWFYGFSPRALLYVISSIRYKKIVFGLKF
jgi:glycogen synthase